MIKFIGDILGAALCAFGLHDWRAVYPARGSFARWDECKRAGCMAKRNYVRRM